MTQLQQFSTIDELQRFLLDHQIPIDQWKAPRCKTIDFLWEELLAEESTLTTPPLCRHLSAIIFYLCQNNQILWETKQQFSTGQIRERNQYPSEKMHTYENWTTATYRGLFEELKLLPKQIKIIPNSYKQTSSLLNSPSYPALQSNYQLHHILCQTSSLPTTNFTTEEIHQIEGKPVTVTNYWDWKPIPDELKGFLL